MQPTRLAFIDRPTRLVGSLVEVQPAYTARQRWEMPVLVALLIIAAFVRFWGVGTYGLHKPDEDTTALPAVHILQDGTPRFPSGMFYARAIGQSYLIAGAIKLFGPSEWSLRLPSVLTGILVVLLAYYLGRRFLRPFWNLSFVGVAALLPALIADSQEVRMYGFMTASLATYMILLLRWERTGERAALGGAVIAMLIGIQFQIIAVFSSPLLLFPGLVRGDTKRLLYGLAALIITGIGFEAFSHWSGSFYPEVLNDYLPHPALLGDAPSAGKVGRGLWVVLPVAVVAVWLTWINVRSVATRSLARVAGALLFLGLVLQALLLYHLAFILLVAGVVLARRHGGSRAAALVGLTTVCLALAAVHVVMLHHADVRPFRKIIGVMVGQPSIWPYLQVAAYSPTAMLILVVGIAITAWRLAAGGKIRDGMLFAMLGVFVPLFGMGFFGWFIPPRYGEFALLPMLLCALSVVQHLFPARGWAATGQPGPPAVAALVGLAIVNPAAVAHGVNPGNRFIDHRAAADYIRSLKLGPRDIIVAEEVLMQTYYLGHVDYWLTGEGSASTYIVPHHGQFVDIYTGTPVIMRAAQWRALLNRPDRGNVYVIGSGEDQADGRHYLRGPEISAVMEGPEFKTVFVAHDGLTKVWKIAAPPSGADDRR